MSLTATFDAGLSRVRLAATAVTGATTSLFERSKNGVLWTTVRGGAAVATAGGVANLDDYEFQPGVINYYRVTGSPGAVTFQTTVTPAQADVWIKSPARPFLNRAIKVVDHTDIVRPSRSQTFEVIGRTMPVAVTDTILSRRWDLTIKADTVEEADTIEIIFSSGDVLFVQVPATGVLSTVPGGYVVVGDVTRRRFGVRSGRRWFDLPMTEVAPPGPGIYGIPATWATTVTEFSTWSNVVANFATWTDVVEHVADPSVVIVP